MEVKPGYKQTEAGVIPNDWDADKLGNFVALQRGHDLTWRDRRRGDVPVMGSAGQNGFHDTAIAKGPGVVLGRSGASFGQAHYCEQDFWPHNTALYVTDFRWNDPLFVFYFLKAIDFTRHNSGGAQQSLNRNFIAPILVGIPRPPEQRVIAGALSDVDALLGILDQFIVKKRDLKRAAMQQLLTGQTRLPGFHGEWAMKVLSEVCWFQEGPGVRNTQFTASGIKLLNGTNIFRGVLNLDTTNRFISEKEGRGAYSHFLADEGDIVLASSGITIERLHEKVAFVRAHDLPFCMNTSTIRFKPFVGVLAPTFLFQFLTSDSFKRMIGGVATGSAQLNFGPSHVAKVELSVPPVAEQTAIAEVLTDLDAELAALEQRRAKTRALKQGMMQELLTGRIRLV